MTKHTIPAAQPATFTHETMCRSDFKSYVADLYGRGKVKAFVPQARYRGVEYFNAAAGLIVLAHDDADSGQVDGIHPASLSKSIDQPRNIIEPMSPLYNIHFMTRRSPGGLILDAFGYMIYADDPRAHPLRPKKGHFLLEMFDTRIGPVVGVFEGQDTVHVIRPVSLHDADAALHGGPF